LALPEGLTGATPSLLRCFRYEADSGVAEEHTDLGLLTLCVGTGRGLEVLDRLADGGPVWVDACGCVGEGEGEGCVVVGDFLRDLSRGLVRSGCHRVVGNPGGRESVVFALRPSLGRRVDGGAFGREGWLDVAEMWRGVKGVKTNINARREIREQQTRARLEKEAEKNGVGKGVESKIIDSGGTG